MSAAGRTPNGSAPERTQQTKPGTNNTATQCRVPRSSTIDSECSYTGLLRPAGLGQRSKPGNDPRTRFRLHQEDRESCYRVESGRDPAQRIKKNSARRQPTIVPNAGYIAANHPVIWPLRLPATSNNPRLMISRIGPTRGKLSCSSNRVKVGVGSPPRYPTTK